MNNIILDYSQVKSKLEELNQNNKVIKETDIGTTKYGLPIEHYTIGKGPRDIVITGATHGCEIVTTDFVLKLMQEMCKDANIDILKKYKLHFIPMLNPEGYLISTSAILTKITTDMTNQDVEKMCKEYYLAYRADDIDAKQVLENGLAPDRFMLKRHQKFFKGIDYNCIPAEYQEIKNAVKSIYMRFTDLPRCTLHTWSSNADGIDIQANCEYNDKIQKILNGEILYKDNFRQSNIQISHPGPVNCPFDSEKRFEMTAENVAINNFLDNLYKNKTLEGYYNYHSTGGMIYQRLPVDAEEIEKNQGLIWNRTISNYVISKLYAEKTYKDINNKENSKYNIIKNEERISSINDVFKIKYPSDVLIELSGMGGNPLAPYGDMKNNYPNLINSNIDAFKHSLRKREYAKNIYDVLVNKTQNLLYNDENVKKVYTFIDVLYNEFNIEDNVNTKEKKAIVEKEVLNEYER